MILLLNRTKEMVVLSIWDINVTQHLGRRGTYTVQRFAAGLCKSEENAFHCHLTALRAGVSSFQA